MSHFDLLLSGGTLIDGTAAPRRLADIALRGDRIAAIGQPGSLAGRQTIDVSGLIVAPGFVDVHNHSDGWMLKVPHLTSKTTQGFTTEVLMSDGISYAPVDEQTAIGWLIYLRSLNGLQLSDYRGWRSIADYLGQIDGRNAQNCIAQIPYANVRTLAMGWGRGPADDTEMRRMRREVRLAMEQGACAVSTGLDYVAQCFAGTSEIAEVCAEMAPWQGLYVTHVRYKKGLLPAVHEAIEIGRRAGVPVHISHLKGGTPREVDELLAYLDGAEARDADVSFDVYPYLPGSTMLNSLLPYEAWEAGPLGVTARLAQPSLRKRFAEQLDDYRLGLDQIRLAWLATQDNRRYIGMSLAEYIDTIGRPAAEALCDLLIEENLAVLCVFHSGDDELVDPFLQHPRFMMGSDGIWFADGRVHPRQYGAATRLLGPLVRDRRLFTLEESVRKLSAFPAERFGLTGRGVVEVGAYADVVVFDADRVTDLATYDDPHRTSQGVRHVLVNGVAVVRDGLPVEVTGGTWPGRALRFKQ